MSEPRYWAFLSYSHADEAAARRLHRALEHYLLPRRVRAAHGLPRRLIPVFRDTEELAAGASLTQRLQDALNDSRWLIVLCSPAAAKSRYVDDEIRHFLRRHGADRILCALIEGEPVAAFPPAIRDLPQEPLAADFRGGRAFHESLLKIVAALAGVSFGELRDREAMRARRKRLIASVGASLIAIGAVLFWDLRHREFVENYGNVGRRHGIWKGVDRLAPEDAARRDRHFRFTRKGRRAPPARVDYLDEAGACPPEGLNDLAGGEPQRDVARRPVRICVVEFEYDAHGALTWQHDALEVGVDYAIGVQAINHLGPMAVVFTGSSIQTTPASPRTHFRNYKRDARGFDEKVLLFSAPTVAIANVEGHHGYAFAYDDAGRVIRRAALDTGGKEIGPAALTRWSAEGLPVEIRYEGAEPGPEGFHTAELGYDPAGRLTRVSFRDAVGQPLALEVPRERLARLHGR